MRSLEGRPKKSAERIRVRWPYPRDFEALWITIAEPSMDDLKEEAVILIRVWSDMKSTGGLDRHGRRGTAFAYDSGVAAAHAVSMTMPVSVASWENDRRLAPIFEMNLPEGILREQLRLAIAEAAGEIDDFDLLTVVGQSQIGRLRYTAADAALDEAVPFQSVDEILQCRRDSSLPQHLLKQFAVHSGISGVQPKILVRDETDAVIFSHNEGRKSANFSGATHVVKFWPHEYNELAANEFFCLKVAERSGLEVPRFRLSDGGAALILDRFDLLPDGTYLGLEDFCVLNARSTAEKYKGGYETALFRRAKEFIDADGWHKEAEKLFILFTINCAVRNGDAHLKNFALIYESVLGGARLAPVYDIVTTTVYLPQDSLALTLDGSTRWPTAKKLEALGTIRCGLAPKRVKEIFEIVAGAMQKTADDIRTYAASHENFRKTGEGMLREWAAGMQATLGFEATSFHVAGTPPTHREVDIEIQPDRAAPKMS
jgi:serine/threonine-protein kinase HipA